jgi:P-type Ca2+ transporter type 2A
MTRLNFETQFLIIDSDGLKEYNVEGTTFAPNGLVTSADGKKVNVELHSEPIQRLAEISAICNDAKIVYNPVSFIPRY